MGTKASKLQVNTMEMVRSIGGYAVNIVVTSNRGVPDVFRVHKRSNVRF